MQVLLYIGISQALFIAFFIGMKKKKSVSDFLICLWLILLAMPLVTKLLSPSVLNISVFELKFNFAFTLTYGPLIWLYTQALVQPKPHQYKQYAFHGIPFILITLVQILFSEQAYYPSFKHGPETLLDKSIGVFTFSSIFIYAVATLYALNKHSSAIMNHYSALPLTVSLNWLKWLTLIFLGLFLLPFIASALNVPELLKSRGLVYTGFIYCLSYFALKQPQLFQQETVTAHQASLSSSQPEPESLQNMASLDNTQAFEVKQDDMGVVTEKKQDKYLKSGLTPDQSQYYCQQLKEYMKSKQPYLDADITIEILAKNLNISRHHLTQTLSEQENKNFYLYINEYRIRSVIAKMSDIKRQKDTLLTLAYESGFNSKSTFNTAFKKVTGMTPSQYRKAMNQV